MKLLLAYDGSPGADAGIEDLSRAGLPAEAEARVLTIGDEALAHLSKPPGRFTAGDEEAAARRRVWLADNARAVNERGVSLVAARFPRWAVTGLVRGGSAATKIVLHADAWEPDLVVVGSRGRVLPLRLLLGSVARRIVTESRCSVRVARPTRAEPGAPARVLVGHDGGGSGRAALRAAMARSWPADSEILVLYARSPDVAPVFLGQEPWEGAPAAPAPPEDRATVRQVVQADVAATERPGVLVTAAIESGRPAQVLLTTARTWRPDCVFVCATEMSSLERFVLGSVSAAVADRAPCSVEVVRVRRAEADARADPAR